MPKTTTTERQNRDDVTAANIEVHRKEAPYYDALHFEERNLYERCRRKRAVDFIKRVFRKRTGQLTALDVGCGTGKLSLLLADSGFEVTSIDLSLEMLQVFKEKPRGRGRADNEPKIICANMFEFLSSCPSRFDLVVFCGTLHHVEDIEEALRLASSRVNDGGVLLITHEPLKQPISSRLRYTFHRANAVLDESLYRLCIRSLPDEAKSIDYSMSDFQRQFGGIDVDEVTSILKSNGFAILDVEKYCARRFALFCAIGNMLIRSQNTFQVIALH